MVISVTKALIAKLGGRLVSVYVTTGINTMSLSRSKCLTATL